MTTTIEHPATIERRPDVAKRHLTAEISGLDPYRLMPELGETVIHRGGGSTGGPLAIADLRPGQRVLDASCGIGTTAAQIARQFDCDVVALDINDSNLALARCTVEQMASTIAWRCAAAISSNSSSTTRRSTW